MGWLYIQVPAFSVEEYSIEKLMTENMNKTRVKHFHLLSSSSGDYPHDQSSFEAFGIYMEREEIEIQGAFQARRRG